MEIIPDKRRVVGLVGQAHTGKICLPNFQRDFVWTREEVLVVDFGTLAPILRIESRSTSG